MILAQQLIDASKDGGAAFLAFAIMVFLFAGSLFYMDKVRRRREDEAPRLLMEVPDLTSLVLEVQDRGSGATGAVKYRRRIVITSAPAHFEIPCLDPACVAGGHEGKQLAQRGTAQLRALAPEAVNLVEVDAYRLVIVTHRVP